MTSQLRFVPAWSLGALLVSGSAPGLAAPATGPSGQPAAVAAGPAGAAAAAAATTPTPAPAKSLSVTEARNTLERGMTELGELAMRARQSGDSIRIACVQSKQDRAEAVMEVATGDLLTAQDPAADAQTRAFAGEKLSEGALQLKDLVAQARACSGREEADKAGAANDARQPQQVLPQDPTNALPPASRGLPPIDPRPPVASPVL
jgi:hypothetical protein